MIKQTNFDVIIIGGSYAGLSAGLALGRSMRTVLIIDGGDPCNRQTPYSHNLITQDGNSPLGILQKAKQQVLKYDTVQFHKELAVKAEKKGEGFRIETQAGSIFSAKKLLFATGLKDNMPSIRGFAACWGISVLHCPYCHGYEVRNQSTGVIANGDVAFHYAQLLLNWTNKLLVFTNGPSTLTIEQTTKMQANNIQIIEKEIDFIHHENGKVQSLYFKDGLIIPVNVIYGRPFIEQKCGLLKDLGCEFTPDGLVKVNDNQQTTIEGVYACGDNSNRRAVSIAVATGSMAGMFLNNKLVEAEF